MGLNVSDDALLQLSAAGLGAYAAAQVAAPKAFHEAHFKVATPYNADTIRYNGVIGGTLAATALTLSNDRTAGITGTKKSQLKVHGAGWAASSALTFANIQNGNVKKDFGLATGVAQAVIGTALLLRGFRQA